MSSTLFHYRLFRDIAVTGSISKAATLHQISQSAASQHIQELERQFGVQLVDRSRRPLLLTEAGQLYAELCRDLIRRWEDFHAAVEQLKSEVVGTVRVAAIFSVGLSEMSGLQSEFSRRFPQAELAVEYLRPERVYHAVRSGQADLGLVSYPHPTKEIAVIPWRCEEMCVAVAPSHPLASRETVSPKDLEGQEFIGFDPDLPIRKDVDRFLRDQGVSVNVIMHFDSIPMVKEALALGSCVSILPSRMLRSEIEQGRLVAVPLREPGLVRPLGIIHLKRKSFNRATDCFLQLLQESHGQAIPKAVASI
ncbi:MAG: LysR family transcriptional regulator [Bryobacteraceae bacterium]|nr:LysR family transcriptional regulator [Bryobacteraceae bacterium]MDW8378214.1 LysR family transcriptional regulator [Bryobacterales bacterium]